MGLPLQTLGSSSRSVIDPHTDSAIASLSEPRSPKGPVQPGAPFLHTELPEVVLLPCVQGAVSAHPGEHLSLRTTCLMPPAEGSGREAGQEQSWPRVSPWAALETQERSACRGWALSALTPSRGRGTVGGGSGPVAHLLSQAAGSVLRL